MQVCIRLMSPENEMLPGNLIIVIACLLEQKKMNGMKFIKYMLQYKSHLT